MTQATPPPELRELLRTGLISGLVLLAAFVVFFGTGIADGSLLFFTHDIAGSDFWNNNYPAKHFYAEELAKGQLPLWAPRMGTGFPLHAAAEVGALYPLNLALFSTLPLPLALNWSILCNFLLAGVFAAMYGRQLGANRGGSVLVAVTFALSGFFLTHLKHMAMLASGAWAPLLLLLLERHAHSRSTRTLVLLALSVGVMMLGSHSQIAYNNLLIAGIYALWICVRQLRGSGGFKSAIGFGARSLYAVVLGLLLSAPQVLPTMELNSTGLRQGGLSMQQASYSAFSWRHLALFANPTAFGDPGNLRNVPDQHPSTGQPITRLSGFEDPTLFWEVTGYVGILALLLAGAAIWLGRRQREVIATSAFLLFALLLALGQSGGLFYLFYNVVPWFDHFRLHGRFLLFVDLWLAVLAGLGLTLAVERFAPGKKAVAVVAAVMAIAITFLDLNHGLGKHNPTVPAEKWLSPPDTARAIAKRQSGKSELFRIFTTDPSSSVFQNAYHRARGWTGSLSPYDPAQRMLDANTASLYGLNHLIAFAPIFPRWCREVSDAAWHPPHPVTREPTGINRSIASLFNVRYLMDPLRLLRDTMPLVGSFRGDTLLAQDYLIEVRRYSIDVYENPKAMPRAFLVPSVRWIDADPQGEVAALKAADFDPARTLLLVRDLHKPAVTPDNDEPILAQVTIQSHEPQRIALSVDAPRDCWLFLSETFYPGWRAEVDGSDVHIWRANVAGRAIQVPGGKHEVVFTYEPDSFRNGRLAALFGLLLTLTLGLQARMVGRVREG